MEYHTPSMFDENGVNVMSPTIQMMRAEGNDPSAHYSSFKYNGDSPYQTAMYNNINPQMYGYNMQQNQQAPPPGFTPMQTPQYGYTNQNSYQSVNPYESMLQQQYLGQQYQQGYSYNPYQQYTQQQSQQYYNGYQQQYSSPYDQRIVEEGRKAQDMLKQAMNLNNPADTSQGMIKYDYYGRPVGEYTYAEIKERNAPIYNQLYNNGLISLSDYCSLNNGGISFIGLDGKRVNIGSSDNWYVGYDRIQQQKAIQAEYQKAYEENMKNWEICLNINKRFLRDEGYTEEAERIDKQQSEEYRKYMQDLQNYHHQILAFDYMYDQQCMIFNSLQRSDSKSYVSPFVEKYVSDWNKLYERRTKPYPEHYGVDEFFNQGIMECQIIDDMAHDMELREKRVDLLFDHAKCRELFAKLFPTYDPVTGTSCAPVSMNVSDIEITLPEHLKRERYEKRRQRFIDTIYQDNRANIINR